MTADRAAVPAKNDHRAVTTDVGTKTQMTAGLGSAVTPARGRMDHPQMPGSPRRTRAPLSAA